MNTCWQNKPTDVEREAARSGVVETQGLRILHLYRWGVDNNEQARVVILSLLQLTISGEGEGILRAPVRKSTLV